MRLNCFCFRSTSEKVKEWFQLGKNRDPEAWEMFPSTVNAYFNPPANEVWLFHGISGHSLTANRSFSLRVSSSRPSSLRTGTYYHFLLGPFANLILHSGLATLPTVLLGKSPRTN